MACTDWQGITDASALLQVEQISRSIFPSSPLPALLCWRSSQSRGQLRSVPRQPRWQYLLSKSMRPHSWTWGSRLASA